MVNKGKPPYLPNKLYIKFKKRKNVLELNHYALCDYC